MHLAGNNVIRPALVAVAVFPLPAADRTCEVDRLDQANGKQVDPGLEGQTVVEVAPQLAVEPSEVADQAAKELES